MSTGNVLYLLMCLAMFGAFSAALAYGSRVQRDPAPAKRPAPAGGPDAQGTATR